jgi:hydroxyethylthiazole kinase
VEGGVTLGTPAPVTPDAAAALLVRVRERRPLIHHITNVVTVNDVANATVAVGAAPVMAQAIEEVEEIAAASSALVLNIGTLTRQTMDAMLRAGRRANAAGVPVIFDPVGAGATSFRTAEAQRLLGTVRVACCRGNAGEVAALAGRSGTVRGVDVAGDVAGVDDVARELATATRAVVAATGRVDVLSDGVRTVWIENGHPLLSRVSGTGCMATALIAAFCAVEPAVLPAAAAGLVCYEVAAELAADDAPGPGTFRVRLLDALASLDPATVVRMARVRS